MAKAKTGFNKEFKPSDELAEIVGSKPIARSQVVKKLWEYIKKHDLQDSKDKRIIIADEALQPIFGGKKRVNMFEMNKLIGKHLK